MTHATIAAVTQRIVERSADTRSAYLARCGRAAEEGSARAHLSCGNIAHVAAAAGRDKAAIAREEGGNESASRPDPETLRFHFDDLTPGTWTFSLYGSFDQDYAEVEVFVNRSTDQATLVFVPEVEDPVDPAALLESAGGK